MVKTKDPADPARRSASDDDERDEVRAQLAASLIRIQELWRELKAAEHHSPQREKLSRRIREEADAYRTILGKASHRD